MTWLQRYRIRHYIENSLVVLPVLGLIVALFLTEWVHSIEKQMGWESTLSVEAVRIVVGTLAASMLTFIVFLSSSLLVAVQLASAQLTPRVIAFIFRDPVTKISLTAFVFNFSVALEVLIRIEDKVPLITSKVAIWGCVVCLGSFFYLLDHVGKELRPSGILKRIGRKGRDVIMSVYPRSLREFPDLPRETLSFLDEEPAFTIPSRKDGVVLAFDIRGLMSLARNTDCLIEMVPQVGDFIAVDDPLFRIYRGGTGPSAVLLSQCVAVGQERTQQQDPALAFRIIVDVASKALSPAINDPTTAVLAIDQIHHLLKQVGNRHLDDGVIRDEQGNIRLIYRTPDWEDFVQLAVTEIRLFGAQSIQVVRRLRSMLEHLIEVLPPERTGNLRQELSSLQITTENCFLAPEDRTLAAAGDSQGMGGAPGRSHSQVNGPSDSTKSASV